ncbi:MAG: hypothetical protein H7235_00750 [Bdellovibrionaceae bacterium]|nr:hypothetical protein [Pseudobdellovibrionaceae bacterium]
MIISSVISALILWSGDYSARLQFDGPLKSEIRGELIDGNKACEVYGRFDEVLIKEKNLPEKFIKVDFRFVCIESGQPAEQIKIAPELIRSSDLKPHSSSLFISNKFKKNSLKIEDYSLVISKKPASKATK